CPSKGVPTALVELAELDLKTSFSPNFNKPCHPTMRRQWACRREYATTSAYRPGCEHHIHPQRQAFSSRPLHSHSPSSSAPCSSLEGSFPFCAQVRHDKSPPRAMPEKQRQWRLESP